MSAKIVLLFCAQAVLASSAFGQYLGGRGLNGLGLGLGGIGIGGLGGIGGCGCGGVASTGGGLPVASASLCPPVGVSVLSENSYAGNLCAGGNLPFLGTVGIEGVLPTAGAGVVSYGCGNGLAAIGAEGPIATGIAGPGSYPPAGPGAYGIAGIGGYGLGGIAGIGGYALGGIGCGCGCGY